MKQYWREFLLIFLYILLYIPALGYSYVQPTDPVWVQRGVQFYEALRHGDFAQTYTKYHPGVILMWITGISYKIFYQFQRMHFGYVRDLFLYQVDLYSMYSFVAKFLIVTLIMVVLLYCYIVIKGLTNPSIAFWTVFFIITEPFVVGNIRSIHVDALAAIFMFAAVISFWASQAENFSSRKYLLLTGIFTGLALLTKISSLVLFPFFVFVLGVRPLWGRTPIKVGLSIKSLLLVCAFSFLVFFALFPSMWVNPVGTVQKIAVDGFLDTALNEESSRIVLGWGTVSLGYKYFSYFVQIVFRTSPLVFIGFLFGLLTFILHLFFNHKAIKPLNRKLKLLLMYSLIFILGYYLMISISDKKIFRYILPMYPFLAIFAAYAVTKAFSFTHPVCLFHTPGV